MAGDVAYSPGDRLGRYRLGRRLGEGVSGVVFAASRDDRDDLALKLLRPERTGEQTVRARFLREAKLASRIDSRHVVPILELGELAGIDYLVMPYYPGGSLAQRLREKGPLGLDETVDLAAQLGRGLDALHEQEIVHRDVKPSNVLLTEERTAALSDFGLARADGQLLGTPDYLAPELIEGAEATVASDLYALGCVLYECLIGAPPFLGRSIAEITYAHLSEPPPDPCEQRAEIPVEVAGALLTALEKDPAGRPTSGTALARMLRIGSSSPPA
jgi:serine/threonine protein kinase